MDTSSLMPSAPIHPCKLPPTLIMWTQQSPEGLSQPVTQTEGLVTREIHFLAVLKPGGQRPRCGRDAPPRKATGRVLLSSSSSWHPWQHLALPGLWPCGSDLGLWLSGCRPVSPRLLLQGCQWWIRGHPALAGPKSHDYRCKTLRPT